MTSSNIPSAKDNPDNDPESLKANASTCIYHQVMQKCRIRPLSLMYLAQVEGEGRIEVVTAEETTLDL